MELRVKMGEFRVSATPITLLATSLGSCVGVAIFDHETKIGGLAHIMLPDSRAHRSSQLRPGRYADTAVAAMVRQMEQLGASVSHLFAWIIGGASMFPSSRPAIGTRNLEAARQELGRLEIPIVDEDVEGGVGRTMMFETGSGRVWVRKREGAGSSLIEQELTAWKV